MAGLGGIPAVQIGLAKNTILNVWFRRYRPLYGVNFEMLDRLLTANSGHWQSQTPSLHIRRNQRIDDFFERYDGASIASCTILRQCNEMGYLTKTQPRFRVCSPFIDTVVRLPYDFINVGRIDQVSMQEDFPVECHARKVWILGTDLCMRFQQLANDMFCESPFFHRTEHV